MKESFQLPLTYHGKEINLEAEFQPRGFSYVIKVTTPDSTVFFERDEENNFRAVQQDMNNPDPNKTDPVLLSAIAASLQHLFS